MKLLQVSVIALILGMFSGMTYDWYWNRVRLSLYAQIIQSHHAGLQRNETAIETLKDQVEKLRWQNRTRTPERR